jgi:hypothetical protein
MMVFASHIELPDNEMFRNVFFWATVFNGTLSEDLSFLSSLTYGLLHSSDTYATSSPITSQCILTRGCQTSTFGEEEEGSSSRTCVYK